MSSFLHYCIMIKVRDVETIIQYIDEGIHCSIEDVQVSTKYNNTINIYGHIEAQSRTECTKEYKRMIMAVKEKFNLGRVYKKFMLYGNKL